MQVKIPSTGNSKRIEWRVGMFSITTTYISFFSNAQQTPIPSDKNSWGPLGSHGNFPSPHWHLECLIGNSWVPVSFSHELCFFGNQSAIGEPCPMVMCWETLGLALDQRYDKLTKRRLTYHSVISKQKDAGFPM